MTPPDVKALCSACGEAAPVASVCVGCMTIHADSVIVPRAVLEQVREAAAAFMDHQNGPPLIRHAEQWHAAERALRAALAAVDGILLEGKK